MLRSHRRGVPDVTRNHAAHACEGENIDGQTFSMQLVTCNYVAHACEGENIDGQTFSMQLVTCNYVAHAREGERLTRVTDESLAVLNSVR